jgi:hypothetical protein
VREDFLLILNAEKLHHKYLKWIKKWFGCVLVDLKNPTQLTALKKAEPSSQKWPPKFAYLAGFSYINWIVLLYYLSIRLLVQW